MRYAYLDNLLLDAIGGALEEQLRREQREINQVRDDVVRQGPAWAAEEIWRLRRALVAARKLAADARLQTGT